MADTSTYALDLEADAARYPDEAGELLMEAAHQWRLGDDATRAHALLEQVRDLGGEDAAYACVTLADLAFEEGDDDQAHAWLAEAEEVLNDNSGAAEMAGELLAEYGRYAEALRWFDLAIGLYGAEAVAQLRNSDLPSPMAPMFLGRRDVRRELGLAPDEYDDLAEELRRRGREFGERIEAYAAAQEREDSGQRLVRLLVWRRAEQAEAAQRWPEVFTAKVLGNHRTVEAELRDGARANPADRVELVIASVAGFDDHLTRTGNDPLQEATRLAYMEEAHAGGEILAWPPGRNEACWCGSERKYKKCCDAPDPLSAPG
ncbi:SEC-C domain-containing protein [Nocardioides sp. AE5]|uniref:SEC-C domain-containing protein n=1 Tax=Nocardioides sp. AE5 TaxID=2962573 RepID=UPI0028818C11|nr:SEC-C domain-containing protein [Nocardioides sp. AE5]MDT0202648.1 SEC-C domain-containing protein [Nocardioides sp. AE5]